MSIHGCFNVLISVESKLHILVNNAGMMMGPQKETEDKFEEQFQVNYLGMYIVVACTNMQASL